MGGPGNGSKLNKANRHSSQSDAQKSIDAQSAAYTAKGATMNPSTVGNHTISATGVQGYSKKWDKEKAGGLSYAEWIKKPANKAKEDKFYASKQINISEGWDDPTVPYKKTGKDIPPPIDGSGFTAEGIPTDAINTKLGNIDGKLQGRGSRLTKRVEEGTDLGAEGFGSKGTPLKTRGIANKNWGLT